MIHTISLGVFCSDAPSTSAIILFKKFIARHRGYLYFKRVAQYLCTDHNRRFQTIKDLP
ncbi:MAG: hypothetical protein ABIN04_16255 [Ginsengibacter sp.]